ncbi:RIP metalloprotease RseP [Chamaesiphon minutus]|uniref:Zinc metalloprotease n=1 Tax=Chamaesiphon minutus (strain ATCC 27169 / PCC 6605) TaxID=1173020 RepID=K9ULS4_CHAP6|nr:RIP metalloprotease RseP [Chamaesiphon minutus]AFY95154.1 RIP metalloprotease RseP [Chamaesiphon minutus PCC 6605]
MSTLAAIGVLAVLIFIHELGHFLAARLQGIYANKFSIGFGPILLKYQGKQTEYALRALPLGGFVGFPDDDPDSDIPANDPNLLRNRPILDRAIVISAGVIANLIFAYFLLVVQVSVTGFQQINYHPGVVVSGIATNLSTAAGKAGLQAKDIIVAVDKEPLGDGKPAIVKLMSEIQNHAQQPLTFEIQRGNETLNLQVTPDANDSGKGQIGVKLAPNADIIIDRSVSPIDALAKGASEFERVVVLTVQGLSQLVTNFGDTASQIAGPIKIVEIGSNIASTNIAGLLQFGALISINLAVMNILPLPALDGGQLAFLLFEGLLGKPLPMKLQETVMQTGLFLLLGLGVFLVIRDTANLSGVQQFFK